MRKILIDLSYINSERKSRESLAIYAFRLLESLAPEEAESMYLMVAQEYVDFFREKYSNYKLVVYPENKSLIYRIPYLKGVCKMLKWRRFVDSLDFELVYLPFAWSGNSLKTRARKVITIHDLKPFKEADRIFTKNSLFRFLGLDSLYYAVSRSFFTRHMKNASRVISISNFVKENIVSEWPEHENKVMAIYNSVILPDSSSKPESVGSGTKFILYVNTLTPYKNVETLLKAFNGIKDSCDHKLVIVGKKTTYWEEMEQYISENGFGERVIRIEYATNEELKWLYENADLFVTTSTREGFGYTPIEAAICKCQVISTLAESLPDVTCNLLNYYDPPGSYEKLGSLMAELLKKKTGNERLDYISSFLAAKYDRHNQAGLIYKTLVNV